MDNTNSNPLVLTKLTLEVPWYVEIPRKTKGGKKVTLNMNTYRNLHHTTNNKAKALLKDLMGSQITGIKLKTPVTVEIQVMKPSRRRLDKGNVYAVASKYLYDAMSEEGVWEDDNDDFVKEEVIKETILDPLKEGRICFTFRTIDDKEMVE